MQRLLGIDYGSRRIGVAVGDDETRIAMPLIILAGRNDPTRDARQTADLGERERIDRFVVGLPLNMDDTDSAQTETTRRFAEELARLSEKPVDLQDERLSTYAAEALCAAAPAGKRPRPSDAVAAQQILQAYLDRTGRT